MQSFEMYQLYLVATALLSLILETKAFSYKDADKWGEKYKSCKGKHQSPIFIKPPSDKSLPEWTKPPLKLTDFEKSPKKLTIKNTGHTVEMKAEWTGDAPSCSDGPLKAKYVFEKVTFLWDPKGYTHMEEVIPMEKQDMEMHMFFYNTDMKSFKKAQKRKGGLVILSLEFSSNYDNPDNYLDTLEKCLHNVRSPKSTAEVPAFAFANIFKKEASMLPFNSYEGSLDSPPCWESVTWFIVDTRARVPRSLLHEFTKIKLENGDTSNVRPTQPLNKRKVMSVYTWNVDRQ